MKPNVMDQEIERYLNDHLAGSAGAVLLIQELADKSKNTTDRRFFGRLKAEVENDRKVLEELLTSIGAEPSSTLRLAGDVTARFGLIKLMWEGFAPGKLGMFEALEMLVLGIQGKRVLWRMLDDLIHWYPEWEEIDFEKLENDARRQRDEVEAYRQREGRNTLVCEQRRKPPRSLP